MKHQEPIPGLAALLPVDAANPEHRAHLVDDLQNGRVVPEVIDIRDRSGNRTGAVRIRAVVLADHWHAGQPEPEWLRALPRPDEDPPC